MNSLKIDHARYILTLDPRRRIIQDGAIVVSGQRIAYAGKAAELANIQAERIIDARHMVVTPGLLNGHMHISYAHAVRGIFADDLPDRLERVFRLQSAMTEEEEYWTSLLAIVELLRGGTTCFIDPGTTQFPDACLQAYQDSGCRIITGQTVTDGPSPLQMPRYEIPEALTRTEAFIRAWDGRLDGRVRAWAMPFSLANCSGELIAGLKRLVDELGAGLTLHHSVSPGLAQAMQDQHGLRPTEYLESIGALGGNVLLAHVMGLDDAEIDCLARSGTNVVMCPSTVAKGGDGIHARGRMPEMLAKGINVALGTDSANSSNYLDMVRAMNMAAVVYKDARQDMRLIPAETALEQATLLGARAFGLGEDVGSIEPGKKADLVLFDTNRPEWQALYNPVNNLVYSADSRSVHTVIVDGKVVVDNYRQSFADEAKLYQEVQEAGERLLARLAWQLPLNRWPVE